MPCQPQPNYETLFHQDTILNAQLSRRMFDKMNEYEKRSYELQHGYLSLSEKYERAIEAYKENLKITQNLSKKVERRDAEIRELKQRLMRYEPPNEVIFNKSMKGTYQGEKKKFKEFSDYLEEMNTFYRSTIQVAAAHSPQAKDFNASSLCKRSSRVFEQSSSKNDRSVEDLIKTSAHLRNDAENVAPKLARNSNGSSLPFEVKKLQIRSQLDEFERELEMIKQRNAKRLNI